MGVVRRAAIEGLIPAPPEGPWTQAWQTVLASSDRLRSQVRALAAWATEREIEPAVITSLDLQEWANKSGCTSKTLGDLQAMVVVGAKPTKQQVLTSANALTHRLRLKARRGTVRDAYE
jgi:hypothetical protein